MLRSAIRAAVLAIPRFLLLLAFAAALPASADVVHLRDGRKLEGKVVAETATSVTLKLKFGEQTIPKSDIDRVERKATTEEEFEERLAAIGAGDANAFHDLGVWAKRRALVSQATACFEKAIAANPDHAGAREELGWKRFENRWVTAAEYPALVREAEEEENRRRGMVEVDGKWIPKADHEAKEMGLVNVGGKWVTPEEKDLIEKGYVRHRGRWVTPEERRMRDRGYDLVNGKWIKHVDVEGQRRSWDQAWEVGSVHYHIKTNISNAFAEEAASLMEQAYDAYRRYFGVDLKRKERKLSVYVFSEKDEYRSYCEKDRRLARWAGQDGVYDVNTNLLLAWSGNNLNFIKTFLVGTGVWQYYYNCVENGLPSWLSEGYAAYFGACTWDGETLVVGLPNSPRIRRFRNALDGGTFIRLRDLVAEELDVVIDEGRFHPFSAEAWALAYFLIKTPNQAYRQAMKTLEERLKTAPFVMGNTDILGHQYFMEAFGEANLDRLERDWMDFIERLSIEDEKRPALPDELKKMEEEEKAAAGGKGKPE